MKRKLIYEAPHSEEFELNLAGNCLQTTSEINPTIDDMPWDE